MAQGHLGEAEQELSAALEVANEVGNPPQLWKTHAAIGDLRRAQGRSDDARDAYREALVETQGRTIQALEHRLLCPRGRAVGRYGATRN